MCGCSSRRWRSTCSCSRSSRCSTAWPSRSSAGTRSSRAFHFIGLQNYQELFADPVFWQASANTAILVIAGVAIQLVHRHRPGLLLRSAAARLLVRARCAHPADAAHADRGRADVAGDAQSRLGHGQLRAGRAGPAAAAVAGRPQPGAVHADPGGLLAVGPVHHGHRVRTPAGIAARLVRGRRRRWRLSLADPLAHHPAADHAGHRLRRHLPRHRCVPLLRCRLRAHLRRAWPPDHDAELLGLGERPALRPLRLLPRPSAT